MNTLPQPQEKVTAITELLTRGVDGVYPSVDFLREKLESDTPLSLYLGIDPTGPLHLGHLVVLTKLAAFQKLGHHVILLVGDFTATIGDPTDKTAARHPLTRAEVRVNMERYENEVARFLDFTCANPARIRHNSEWHDTLTFERVLQIASHLTVDQLLKRDMFERRMHEGKPIHIHEFLYPLMQGYDSVALEADGEIGASDQMFNMLVGRALEKQLLGKEKFVITTKLLTDPTGRKMSKSEGNVVWLHDPPHEQFGKVMRWTDSMILPGFELCTELPREELETIGNELRDGTNPRDLKLRLARAIIARLRGEGAAHDAERSFRATFITGGTPPDSPEIAPKDDETLLDIVVRSGITESKAETRRLIMSGAIETETGERLTDPKALSPHGVVLRIGKRRFLKIH